MNKVGVTLLDPKIAVPTPTYRAAVTLHQLENRTSSDLRAKVDSCGARRGPGIPGPQRPEWMGGAPEGSDAGGAAASSAARITASGLAEPS